VATTLTRTYADFWTVTQDALDLAAQKAGLELTPAGRQRLMAAWLELKGGQRSREHCVLTVALKSMQC
jgi:hypothetical protein